VYGAGFRVYKVGSRVKGLGSRPPAAAGAPGRTRKLTETGRSCPKTVKTRAGLPARPLIRNVASWYGALRSRGSMCKMSQICVRCPKYPQCPSGRAMHWALAHLLEWESLAEGDADGAGALPDQMPANHGPLPSETFASLNFRLKSNKEEEREQ